nr:hypothetical protein [Nonomuraea coxensis]
MEAKAGGEFQRTLVRGLGHDHDRLVGKFVGRGAQRGRCGLVRESRAPRIASQYIAQFQLSAVLGDMSGTIGLPAGEHQCSDE